MRWRTPRLRLLSLASLLSLVVAGSLFVACRSPRVGLRECPHDWVQLPRDQKDEHAGMVTPGSGLPLVGSITNVPEFHDCQRLLIDGGKKFGPLVAIFASESLGVLDERLAELRQKHNARIADALKEGGDTSALPMQIGKAGALVYNLDNADYPQLGIKSGHNCLVLWYSFTFEWRAALEPVSDPAKCLQVFDVRMLNVAELKVVPRNPKGIVANAAYAPVTRWDWDPSNGGHQYVGLKCGPAWCEVGDLDFTPVPSYGEGVPVADPMQLIKGWYDEQVLAVPRKWWFGLEPGPVKGIVFPAPEAVGKPWTDYNGQWVPTAYVALNGTSQRYKDVFNFDETPPNATFSQMNKLVFCFGKKAICKIPSPGTANVKVSKCVVDVGPLEERWWLRIDAATSGRTIYRCVTRYSLSNLPVPIPPTARWRWIADDETVWKECIQGCCEAESSTALM
jgi:hypothetical protein